MPDWLNIRVDGLSFFLGVIAGTLFWILFSQFKGWLPRLVLIGKQILHNIRERNFAGVEAAIRLDSLKRAQKSHIASQLFSLDEILITPRLIAPPPLLDPTQNHYPESIIATVFPPLPDWPELTSQYPVECLSLAQAVLQGANLVVVGQIGSGKTTALAHFAAQMALKDPILGTRQNLVPIYLHIQDLLPQITTSSTGPLAGITRIMTARVPIFAQNQVPSFFKISLSESRLMLLLDGLDELPSAAFKEAVAALNLLLKENPKLRVVTTGSPTYLDGLIELGFHPVTLAAWNREERTQFVEKWGRNWKEKIQPEFKKKIDLNSLDPVFVNNWIQQNQIQLTPLDWTILLWSVYAGQADSASPLRATTHWVSRLLPDSALLPPLSILAFDVLKNQKANFRQEDLEALSAHSTLPQIQPVDPAVVPGETAPQARNKPAREKPGINASPWISALVQNGVLVEHPGKIYRFSHPVIAAYLAASATSAMAELNLPSEADSWDVRSLAQAYFCGLYPESIEIPALWLQGDAPLFRRTLNMGRLLKFIPANHSAKARILKRIADGMLDDQNMQSTCFRFSNALTCSNDPSVPILFRQLLSSQKAGVRSMACLALGALGDDKSLNQIANLLADKMDEVRRDACFAIGNLRSTGAFDILNECLSADDEILRQTAAETLSGNPRNGYDILKQAAESENLLVRRSAVFGLVLVKETWARELLEKIAIQDGQWVVRNAASQALDVLQKPKSRIPAPLTAPSETPWLLAFASKQGVSIPPGDPAQGMLMDALRSGNELERIAALYYLREYSDEKVIDAVADAARHGEPPLSETAQLALWYIACHAPESIKNIQADRR